MSIRNKKALITGSLGLIGFETSLLFLKEGYQVIGIDNNLRSKIFHIKTRYRFKLKLLRDNYPNKYTYLNFDIRNKKRVFELFKDEGKKLYAVIHTAAQTSHDWAQKDPFLDFSVNANGTLNLLEATRLYSPDSIFIFTSTNKVYGDLVNYLPLVEYKTRYDLDIKTPNFNGIDEFFPIDHSTHSLFGTSKASADLLAQEYGRYFGLKTGVFRLGVVAGERQSPSVYQGFLSFMIEKLVRNQEFSIFGYKGKQVRDVIHVKDVAMAFFLFCQKPTAGEVFNLGGGRENSVSINELVKKLHALFGIRLSTTYIDTPRKGDHKWWITDCARFKQRFPQWSVGYGLDEIILDIYNSFLHDVFR